MTQNIPTRWIGRASSTVISPAPANLPARSTASRSRSRTTTILSTCARRRQRRRSTPTIARPTTPPWSPSCARRARSFSARPTWTSTLPRELPAAPSAARPAIPTTRRGYPGDRAAARPRRWRPTSPCAPWARTHPARCAFRHRAAAWSAWSRPKGWSAATASCRCHLPGTAAARSAAPCKTRRSFSKFSPATIPKIRSRRLAPRSPGFRMRGLPVENRCAEKGWGCCVI